MVFWKFKVEQPLEGTRVSTYTVKDNSYDEAVKTMQVVLATNHVYYPVKNIIDDKQVLDLAAERIKTVKRINQIDEVLIVEKEQNRWMNHDEVLAYVSQNGKTKAIKTSHIADDIYLVRTLEKILL